MAKANRIGQTRPFCHRNGLFSFVAWTGDEWIRVETNHGAFYRKSQADYYGRRTFDDYDDHEYFGRVAKQAAK